MRDLWKATVKFLVSMRLTVALLACGIVLVFAATLAQVDLGVWGVHEQFFHAYVAFWHVLGIVIPLPGGYLVGGLLLINLLSAHFSRFKLTWRKLGIHLTHIGVILLLVGELLAGIWQKEYNMRIDEGQTARYGESSRYYELAIIDTTDPKVDDVVAIPAELLARREPLQAAKLPFRVIPHEYWVNTDVHGPVEAPGQYLGSQYSNHGYGSKVNFDSIPPTTQDDFRNMPATSVELAGPDGPIGTWLVGTWKLALNGNPVDMFEEQTFEYNHRTYRLALRLVRDYEAFTIKLIKFSHDRYAGTDTAKNFSSRIRLKSDDGADDRDVLIYMNNPLRYRGLTFYQSSFDPKTDRTTILQVVRNPSWQLPYLSCCLVALGLVIQFGFSLGNFINRRKAAAAAP